VRSSRTASGLAGQQAFNGLHCRLPNSTLKMPIESVQNGVSTRQMLHVAQDRLRKAVTIVGRHPTLFLAVPSIYLLLAYPPLWKDIDALGQLVWSAGWCNILHFPPLYCFTGRIPFWIGDCIDALLNGQSLPAFNLFAGQHPTALGVEMLIITQHATLIGALTLLVRTAAKTAFSRGVVVLCFICSSALYAQQQCAGSEAPSVTAIIFLAVCGLWVMQRQDWRAWAAFTIALIAVLGTRHINCVLVLWLPIAMGGSLLLRVYRREPIRQALGKFGLAVICGGVALAADSLVVRVMIAQVGQEYRPDLGYPITDRIGAFLCKLSPAERTRLAQKLAASESDPAMQAAIETDAKLGTTNAELADIVRAVVRRQGVPESSILARSDIVILRAALDYMKTLHPKLVDMIFSDFLHGYVREDNGKLSLNRFLGNRDAASMRQSDPNSWAPLAALRSIDYEDALKLVRRAQGDPYLMLWGPIPLITLVVGNIMLCVRLKRRDKGTIAWLSLSLLATSAVLYFATCICAFFNDRYTLPLLVCGVGALGVQVGALLDPVEDQNRDSECQKTGVASAS
jgi:hypothetical protein